VSVVWRLRGSAVRADQPRGVATRASANVVVGVM
jgi:hypothetical protein